MRALVVRIPLRLRSGVTHAQRGLTSTSTAFPTPSDQASTCIASRAESGGETGHANVFVTFELKGYTELVKAFAAWRAPGFPVYTAHHGPEATASGGQQSSHKSAKDAALSKRDADCTLAAKQESLDDLHSENERLLTDVHSTKRSHEALLDANQQLANLLETTEEQHSDLLSSHAKLTANHERLHGRFEGLRAERERLQGRFEGLRAEHQGLQGIFEKDSAAQREQQHHFQKQQQLASHAHRFVLRMLDTVVMHKQKLRCSLDAEMASHQETKGHRDELDHQLSLKTKAHDYTMALLDNITAEAHVTAQQLKSQTAAHQQTKSALLSAERQTQSSADELTQSKQATRFALSCLSRAHAHMDLICSDRDDLKRKHAQREVQSSELQLKLSESESQRSDLERRLAETGLRCSQLEWGLTADLQTLQDEVLALEDRLEEAQQAKYGPLDALKEELQESEQARQQLATQLQEQDARQGKMIAVRSELQRSEQARLQLQTQLQQQQKLQKQLQQQQQKQLQRANQKQQQIRQHLRSGTQQLQQQQQQLQRQLDSERDLHRDHRHKLTEQSRQEIVKHEQKLAKSEALRSELHGQLRRQTESGSELETQLRESEAQRDELQKELGGLQLNLGQLHELALSGRLSPQDIFDMFATPVTPAVAGSPAAVADSPPAAAETPSAVSDSSPAVVDSADKSLAVAGAQDRGHSDASEDSQSPALNTIYITEAAAKSVTGMGPQATTSSAIDNGSFVETAKLDGTIQAELPHVASKDKAAQLQREMVMHPNLTLSSALDLGAAAYARSIEGCNFSTQEVILSMLEHDSTFRNMVLAESAAACIDHINVEFAIADAYRYCLAMEHMQSRRGKAQRPAWATEQAQGVWAIVGRAVAVDESTDTAGRICMIIPNTWDMYQKAALQLLYSYWGVPYEVDVHI